MTTVKAKPDMLLWLSDSRGVYIPQAFAESFADRSKHVSGVSDEDWQILEAGPDHELYWDTWNDVEQSAIVADYEHLKRELESIGYKLKVYQRSLRAFTDIRREALMA